MKNNEQLFDLQNKLLRAELAILAML